MSLWKIKLPRGKKENLPSLSLGEPAYITDEGELYIGGINGENINITNNKELNALKNNTTKQTTTPLELYVSMTGADDNEGTQEKPFKTIQKAISSIPKCVLHSVTINISDSSYETTEIGFDGFYGTNVISVNATGSVIIRGIALNNCTTPIQINGFTIVKTEGSYGISVINCSKIMLENITDIVSASRIGIRAEYSNVKVSNSIISNKNYALNSGECGVLLSLNNSGDNNTVALRTSGGVIMKAGTQPNGSTAEQVNNGGIIR